MSDALYLKKELATNVPMIITMHKRAGSYPEKDFTTKQPTGKSEYLYIFTDDRGRELKHYAKEREEENLKLFNPGEKLQVVRQEKVFEDGKRGAYLVWTDPAGAEARSAATPQIHSNTAETRIDRKQNDHDLERAAHDWKLGLAGLLQAFITRGLEIGPAREQAVIQAKWIREEAMRQALAERDGESVPEVPEYQPSIRPEDLPF